MKHPSKGMIDLNESDPWDRTTNKMHLLFRWLNHRKLEQFYVS